MATWFIAFIFTIGASAWIYSKLMRTTGNNTKNSIIGASVGGILIFILVLIVVAVINSSIN